jgi:hypothetical protein
MTCLSVSLFITNGIILDLCSLMTLQYVAAPMKRLKKTEKPFFINISNNSILQQVVKIVVP